MVLNEAIFCLNYSAHIVSDVYDNINRFYTQAKTLGCSKIL